MERNKWRPDNGIFHLPGAGKIPSGFIPAFIYGQEIMDRMSGMRREGTPAWMQVVERRREQAAEDARSRPVCVERARLQDIGGRAASGTSGRGGRSVSGTGRRGGPQPPRRGLACIFAGEAAQGVVRTRLVSKSVTCVTHFGGTSPCRTETLIQAGFL